MIPIYRAKKLNSDEYIEGYLLQDCFGFYIIPTNYALRCESLNNESIEIDPTTLAIHFSNMIDIKGDKIFASLQEDGKGGDILFDMEYEYTLSFDGLKFKLEGLFSQPNFNKFDKWEAFDIIGIEE